MSEHPFIDSHLPEGISSAIEVANKMWWNIEILKVDNEWCVWTGEVLSFKSENYETAEAFVLGLGLAYAVIPKDKFNNLLDDLRPIIE
jgi:hypothetical protein